MIRILGLLVLCCFCSGLVIRNEDSETLSCDNLSAYLFVYFGGNDTRVNSEAVRFAVSADGYHYYALNQNKEVPDSKKISNTGDARNQHILREPDGKTFYMVCTDVVAANGWDSNRGMVLLKSKDLVNRSSSVINLQNTDVRSGNLKHVWAPQTIYDVKTDKFMVYFSMKHGDGPDIIYYASHQ